jgi:uncharacterized membrane protein YczE
MITSLPARLIRLLAGLLLYGFAEALMIRAAIGIDPWTVLSQGVSRSTGLSIGLLTVAIGAVVLLVWIPLQQRPGFGTVANVLLLGPFMELGLWLLPSPVGTLWLQIAFFTAGLLLLAGASGIYIGAALGPGPRDGLMTGIHSRVGWPIWAARTAVEGTVLALGWLLGGDVGFGTLAFALLIGPLCGITLPLLGASGARPDRTVRAGRGARAATSTPWRPSPLPSRRASSRARA